MFIDLKRMDHEVENSQIHIRLSIKKMLINLTKSSGIWNMFMSSNNVRKIKNNSRIHKLLAYLKNVHKFRKTFIKRNKCCLIKKLIKDRKQNIWTFKHVYEFRKCSWIHKSCEYKIFSFIFKNDSEFKNGSSIWKDVGVFKKITATTLEMMNVLRNSKQKIDVFWSN